MKSKAIIIIGTVISAMLLSSIVLGDWPGAKDDYGPPYTSYDLNKTCGDFIRAKDKKNAGDAYDYYIFYYWVRGYISGLNSSLVRGGNVLGSNDANFDDFMLIVDGYCKKNPLDRFGNAISVPLNDITSVDWEGKSYKKSK